MKAAAVVLTCLCFFGSIDKDWLYLAVLLALLGED